MNNLERDVRDTLRETVKNISPSFSFEDVWAKHNEDAKLVRNAICVPKWVTGVTASLAGVLAAAAIITTTVPHWTSRLVLGRSSNKPAITSTQMDTATGTGIKMFQAKHPQIELGFAYDPSTNRLSMRMVVGKKISKSTAESLLNQLLTDISKSVPGHPISLSQLLQMNYLHFEFAFANRNRKVAMGPLYYGDKKLNSTHIELNSTPNHRPVWNVEQPVIPGTSTEVDGWVSKGTIATLIQIDGTSQTCSPNSDGYFDCGVTIPNSIRRGTATIRLLENHQVLLKKTVSVAKVH